MDENLGSILERVADAAAELDPGRVAVVQGERGRTWPDLDERAARLAGHLRGRGVAPGSRVGVALHNSIEYVETLLALFKLRAVPVNVNYRYREGELEEVLSHTGITGLVLDDALSGPIARVASRRPSLRCVVHVGETADAGDHGEQQICEYEAALRSPSVEREPRSGGDHIVILTGGTTGTPKGIVWEHSGVRAVVSSVYRRRGLPVPVGIDETVRVAHRAMAENSAPVMLPASPLMHGTGFFFTLGNLLLGGRIVLMTSRSLEAAEVWAAIRQHRVEELAIVGDAFARPLLAELAAASGRGEPYDISSLRRVVSSGVSWSPESKRALLRAGGMILQDSIASTEGGPYGVSLSGPDERSVATTFSLPPNARVIAPDGTDVVPGSGQVGLLASSGALPLGYLDDPRRTAEVFRVIDGVRYAVPGDAARVESDGSLTLLGRGQSVINTGGEKVFAEEVEETLLSHPAVEDVAVVGVPSERWGSQVTALVRPRSGERPLPSDLAEYVVARLAGYKRPRQVFVVDEIRRTASGKTDRRWAGDTAERLAAAALSSNGSADD